MKLFWQNYNEYLLTTNNNNFNLTKPDDDFFSLEGQSIEKITFKDKTVTTYSASSLFSIHGTAEVGNTLSIKENNSDPDGTGTLTYSWQTTSDGNNWNEVSTSSSYLVTSSEEGKSIKAVISYKDGQGFDEKVTTSSKNIPYINNGKASFSIIGNAAIGQTLLSKKIIQILMEQEPLLIVGKHLVMTITGMK